MSVHQLNAAIVKANDNAHKRRDLMKAKIQMKIPKLEE